MTTLLRPLALGELLDRTFQLYRQHFGVFVGIAALPHLVPFGFQLAGVALWLGAPPAFTLASISWQLTGLIVALVAATLSQAATVVAVSQLYLGRSVMIGQAFVSIKDRVLELCLITIGVGFCVGLGFLALVIPGILLALRWSLVVPVAVIEQTGLRGAMSRSADLTEGHRGRIFVIFCLYLVLTMILNSVWEIPVLGATFAARRAGLPAPLWTQVLVLAGSFLTQCLLVPLSTIAFSLVYYDERVRKEAFDLEHMMERLDPPLADAAAGV